MYQSFPRTSFGQKVFGHKAGAALPKHAGGSSQFCHTQIANVAGRETHNPVGFESLPPNSKEDHRRYK